MLLQTAQFCAQENKHTAPGYHVFKLGAAYWYDDDYTLVKRGGMPSTSSHYPTDYIELYQTSVGTPAITLEYNYYHPRTEYFGAVIGTVYTFNETFYHYSSYKQITNANSQYVKEYGTGSCALQNHRFKLILGWNFNTRMGFRFYIQPLNPEIRFINGMTKISVNSYEGYKYKKPILSVQYGGDSTSAYTGTETRVFNYNERGPGITLCFPTTFGFEQDIRIKKRLFVAGINCTFSAIEKYVAARFYIGIRFAEKDETENPTRIK